MSWLQVNDTFTLIEMAIGLCNAAIIEMRKMVVDSGFSCTENEIFFFKHLKSKVNSKLIFYIQLFEIEAKRKKN